MNGWLIAWVVCVGGVCVGLGRNLWINLKDGPNFDRLDEAGRWLNFAGVCLVLMWACWLGVMVTL